MARRGRPAGESNSSRVGSTTEAGGWGREEEQGQQEEQGQGQGSGEPGKMDIG